MASSHCSGSGHACKRGNGHSGSNGCGNGHSGSNGCRTREGPMLLGSGGSDGEFQRVVEAVVAPKHLAAREKGGRAEACAVSVDSRSFSLFGSACARAIRSAAGSPSASRISPTASGVWMSRSSTKFRRMIRRQYSPIHGWSTPTSATRNGSTESRGKIDNGSTESRGKIEGCRQGTPYLAHWRIMSFHM